MITDVATDDFKAAMTAITQEVDAMARGVGPKISVHIGFTSVLSRAVDDSLAGEWSVGFTWFKNSHCFGATKCDKFLHRAIEGAMQKLRDNYCMAEPCSICGGRMDGKCYHTHEEEPEPIAPDAPPLHREVNEVAAMAHMAEAIDLISDASNRPETVIYTEREHPDDERDGAGPS